MWWDVAWPKIGAIVVWWDRQKPLPRSQQPHIDATIHHTFARPATHTRSPQRGWHGDGTACAAHSMCSAKMRQYKDWQAMELQDDLRAHIVTEAAPDLPPQGLDPRP